MPEFVPKATAVTSQGLIELVQGLPGILRESRAPSTNKIYGQAYIKWKRWASKYPEINILPADPIHIALYLSHLAKSAKSFSVINTALCAITWSHNLSGLESPSKHILVIETLRGLKRQLARSSKPKEPFEKEHIIKFVSIMKEESLSDVRNTAIIVLAFLALLRFDELSNILIKHVSFQKSHIEIKIPKSKADQLRQGNAVVIARINAEHCPVKILSHYMGIANLNEKTEKENYLFRRCITRKGKIMLTEKLLPMTYSSIRDIVKTKATEIGLNNAQYGTHSMRSGGATVAANSEIGDRMLQRHGRWACASSRDRYVKDSLAQRLSVSKTIGST